MCRIGPSTPMGNLMRQYWLPAIRSDELPRPDSDPLRANDIACCTAGVFEQPRQVTLQSLPKQPEFVDVALAVRPIG